MGNKHTAVNRPDPGTSVATRLTREGIRDMSNRKPFRPKAIKRRARDEARKDKDGAFRVNHKDCPVFYHSVPKEGIHT